MSTLYESMREAATILEEAAGKVGWGLSSSWSPSELRKWSNTWEAEDKAKAEQDELVDQIALKLYKSNPDYSLAWCDLHRNEQSFYTVQAKAILKAFDVKPKSG